MQHLRIVFPLVAASFFLACSDVGTSPSTETIPAFKDEFLSLTVDADKAYSDRLVTFMVRCTTVVTGKGTVWFNAYCDRHPGEIHVESPIDAMLIHDSIPQITIPATFVAGQPFEMPIRCRFLQSDVSCFYYATITLDSVFIADSNRYFDVDADIVTKLSKARNGYGWRVSNQGGTQALYPP